ncbi:MAG: four helix bundle protein [Planctomycetes bacterium]|nr:four helix bundle protein [Planctomycetota bacterium]
MERRVRPFDIYERTFEFAIRVLEVTAALPAVPEAQIARTQLARCGSSVGANTDESGGALTPKERRKYLVIARREARESRFWLRIVHRLWGHSIDVAPDIQEATELRNILSALIRKLEAA